MLFDIDIKVHHGVAMDEMSQATNWELVMGPGQNFLILGLGWVWSATYESGNFPPKTTIPSRSKKILSGRVKKYPGQGRVGPLFTVGQKYAWVGSGQGPSLLRTLIQDCWFNPQPCWCHLELTDGPNRSWMNEWMPATFWILKYKSAIPPQWRLK